jgi:hypothetical protein
MWVVSVNRRYRIIKTKHLNYTAFDATGNQLVIVLGKGDEIENVLWLILRKLSGGTVGSRRIAS